MSLAYEYVETEAEREEALRVRAREILRAHRGLLLSLTPEQMRTLAEMDPGPSTEIGLTQE
jgi:hypothetical protein